jgi:Zn finger protein HypA/HybF involved in hydrogenase expression
LYQEGKEMKVARRCPHCNGQLTETDMETHVCNECKKEYDFLKDGSWICVGMGIDLKEAKK